jgi:SpoVK/Ycf46/Vps4 family AAA+-type ATPase
MVLDDTMDAFATIMRDIPDKALPHSFFKQMLSMRENRSITQMDSSIYLDKLLTEKRALPADADVKPPEFLLMLNEAIQPEAVQTLVFNWMNTVSNFSKLMMTDEAILAAQKSAKIIEHTSNLHSEMLGKIMTRESSLIRLNRGPRGGPGANDNDSNDDDEKDAKKEKEKDNDSNGVIIHRADDIADVDAEMAKLIGLEEAKTQVKKIRARVEYKKAMIDAGLLTGDRASMDHYIFRGPPGTGKTTFARMIGKIYKDAGLLKKGDVIEGSRVSLVAGFVGQTALKTQKAVKQATDGVLFIDEAYSLFGEGNDFGKEAVEVILRAMETHKDKLIVVFAGYPDKMDQLIQSNPGLTRRFKHTVNFKDFQMSELMEIFDKNLERRSMSIEPAARIQVEKVLGEIKALKGKDFGNAGTVENIVDLLLDEHAAATKDDGSVDKLRKINEAKIEIPAALKTRMTTITLAETMTIKPQNEIVQAKRAIGFLHS